MPQHHDRRRRNNRRMSHKKRLICSLSSDVALVSCEQRDQAPSSRGSANVTVAREHGRSALADLKQSSIAVVVLTYSRVHLLRKCVENVLLRTSETTKEIVIWNNASTDTTAAYLDSLSDPRIRVVHHQENIGQNAYAHAFELTSGEHLIELDDDIIDAPPNWDARLLDAFRRLPDVGFLAANLVDNEHDATARIMYGQNAHLYRFVEENGVRLKLGPTGGGCSMTSRELYKRVGGFRQNKKHVFWLEDAAYIADLEKLGYRAAYVDDLQVLHAGGAYYSQIVPEKAAYWMDYRRMVARKQAAKRLLLRIPLIRPLNERYAWFQPPPDATR
jgi:GT2 family glycosyltransferase